MVSRRTRTVAAMGTDGHSVAIAASHRLSDRCVVLLAALRTSLSVVLRARHTSGATMTPPGCS